jgi:anti-sigma B factor antagonist
MNISERKEGSAMIVGFSGRLDANTSQELQDKLIKIVDNGENALVINCTQLEYVSSAGLRVFLTVLKKLTSINGKLALFGCKDSIKQIFDISGFTSLFQLFESKDEAVNSVSK